MHQSLKLSAVVAWLLCAAACLVAFISIGILLLQRSQSENALKLVGEAVWILFTVPFAITAALIVSRQRGNLIGWLLMVPVVFLGIIAPPIDNYLKSILTPPVVPGFMFLLLVWFSNWNWLALILPLLLVALLFPNGKLPSARWRWVLILSAILFAAFLLSAAFTKKMVTSDADWTVSNPIGYLDESLYQILSVFWIAGFIVMTISSAASLFVRYRRSGGVEREQIKWLLYACGIFVVIFIIGFWNNLPSGDNSIANIYNLLFGLVILAFPTSIAIAILRYRLWDIDLIIRRTLSYGVITAVLALIYLGGVTLFQQIVTSLTGQNSPAAVVLSTLLIAALFTPLRRRVQMVIDRRFYRRKVDATRALEEFSAVARSEVEFEVIGSRLATAVQESLEPESVSLWLKKQEGNR